MTTHEKEVIALKRIEGQVRGIIRMIEDKRYCVDILLQLSAVKSALFRVAERILERHIRGCIVQAFKKGSNREKEKKIQEIIELLSRTRNLK